MEEARFFYYSNLAKYSITNNFILIILIIIEMYPILIDFMEGPFILKNFYNNIKNSYLKENIKYKPLIRIKKINLYKLFRKLKNEDKLYPLYILIPMLLLIITYIIFFIIFSIVDKNNKDKGIQRSNSLVTYFKIFFVNLYDHIVFRTTSLYLYDVIITYLIFSNNYIIIFFTIIIFSITVYLNVEYFATFRLNIKYDLDYKYVYDGKFMLYADYFTLIIKISICFIHNVEYDTIVCFFIIFEFIIAIISVFKFTNLNCFSFLNCIKGMFYILFNFIYLLNFIFPKITKNYKLFYIYLGISFLCSFVITFYLRHYKILKLIRAEIIPENNLLTQEKFELLCEYYQYPNFNHLLNEICFAMKIKSSDEKIPLIQKANLQNNSKTGTKSLKDNNILLHNFLTFISSKFKEDSENIYLDKDVNLFYYIICKIYLELMTNQQNNFYLLFETRKILLRLRKSNLVLYYNLKFFYELLCQEYAYQNNVNFLIYNDAFYKIFESVKFFLKEYRLFIQKRNFLITKNYINLAKQLSEFKEKVKINYEILSTSSYKDEYQRIILRIVLESLFNKGIIKGSSSMLINEEFSIYEEMLDKQFQIDQYLKIRIHLKNMSTEIVKIGKELNFLWSKSIDSMFPYQFVNIAKKQLYYDFETQKKNFGGQMYKFFIWDKEQNLKQFIFIYKIYPIIKHDIAYLDGIYQLGSENLIITEIDLSTKQENIIFTSKSLQKYIYINQKFIDMLEKFKSYINLNSFIHLYDNYCFHFSTYLRYINNLLDKLINMCGKEELNSLSSLIKDIKNLEIANDNNINYQLINIYSLSEKNYTFQKEYRFYTLKQIKDRYSIKHLSIGRWDNKEDLINDNQLFFSTQNDLTSVINAFESNSISSISGGIDNFISNNSMSKRKIVLKNNQNKNIMIIIIFNFLVILVAIFALIYENSLNTLLLHKISFYKAVYYFNTLILNTMFGYYSLLCYVKKNGEKCIHEMKTYLNDIGFPEIYTFNHYEHELKVSDLSERFKNLKKEVEKSKDNDIKQYLSSKKDEIHLSFVNGILKYNIEREQTFDYLMGSFINKLIITTNSDDFQTAEIYPVIVNEDFQPIKLVNNKNLKELGSTQIFVYEIMTSYLDYSNHFYDMQESIEEKANNQIKKNKNTLTVFIIALITSNILVMGICFYFFKDFKKIVNEQLQSMEILLKKERNIEIINQKLQIIKILFRLYRQNPIDLLKKLNENIKFQIKKEKEPNNNNINSIEEDIEIQKIKNKIYDLSFIINPFIIILILLVIIYIIYSIIFLIISNKSFNSLFYICEIIETSSYNCLEYFLELGIVQLYQFVKIPENGLYKTLNSIYKNKPSNESKNAYVDLLNKIQDTIQKEKSLKELQKEIGDTKNLISLNCSTLFSQLNDERFSFIFKEHTEVDYEKILIEYCYTVPSLQYEDEDLLLRDLTYSIMKLLVINYNNKDNIPHYDLSELYSVTIKSLELYRPLKIYLGEHYFLYLDNKTDSHFYILLAFLLGNILLEIIYFIIIKIKIIDKIEKINKNMNKLLKMLKCIN